MSPWWWWPYRPLRTEYPSFSAAAFCLSRLFQGRSAEHLCAAAEHGADMGLRHLGCQREDSGLWVYLRCLQLPAGVLLAVPTSPSPNNPLLLITSIPSFNHFSTFLKWYLMRTIASHWIKKTQTMITEFPSHHLMLLGRIWLMTYFSIP